MLTNMSNVFDFQQQRVGVNENTRGQKKNWNEKQLSIVNYTESRIFSRILIVKSIHVVRNAAKEDQWVSQSLMQKFDATRAK